MAAAERRMVSLGRVRFDPVEEQEKLAEGDDNDDGFSKTRTVGVWVVQCTGPLSATDVDRLKATFDLRLTEFVPENAYVERLKKGTAAVLRQDPVIRAVVPFRNEFKLAPTLELLDSAKDDEFATLQVALFEGADPLLVADRLIDLGATNLVMPKGQRTHGLAVVAFSMAPKQLTDLSGIAEVRWIEPFPEIVDDGPDRSGSLAGPPGTAGSTAALWAAGLHGEGQVIGMLDSGPADLQHCFFVDPEVADPGPSHRKVIAVRNALGSPPGPHATFTTGCAAGDDINQPGMAPLRGGAWAARLVLGNRLVLNCFNTGQPELATTLFDELTAGAAAGATVHSNSWHAKPQGPRKPAIYDLMAIDVDTFTWNDEDQLVLGSTGNNNEEQGPPGAAKNAVAVSAALVDTEHPALGDGNPGPTADGRRKPDVMAVGCGIESAIVSTPCGTGPRQSCASSYATPFAAAAAALARQYFVEGRYPTGQPLKSDAFLPSGALLKATLVNSATPAVAGFPHDATGWGLIDLRRTLPLDRGARRLGVWDVRRISGLTTGQVADHQFGVDNTAEPLRVTLVWTEPPGAPGAQVMVNQLIMEVVDPQGQTFIGNALTNGESVLGGEPDPLNNVQMVSIVAPVEGRWVVRVRAPAVNVGAPGQGYALVVTGGITSTEPR